jgi:metallo-beta-lactamase class B
MKSVARVFGLTALVLFGFGSQGHVHGTSRLNQPAGSQLSLETTAKERGWTEPAEPVKVVGPIYFVGTRGLGVWLITTSEGNILLNSGMPGSGPMIEASIRKLGFKPEDTRLMLTCHAHIDHVGGHAYFKNISGAKVVMMDKEVELIQSGGKTDFNYGTVSEFAFVPVEVDRVVRDGEAVRLGDVTLKALLTPGHTRGSTTWVATVTDHGKRYSVAFPDGTSVNPGYRLINDPSYPGIADDYRRTFRVLDALKPDIWLTPHTEMINFEAKRQRAIKMGAAAWVDPIGYRKWVASRRAAFDAAVKKETGVAALRILKYGLDNSAFLLNTEVTTSLTW